MKQNLDAPDRYVVESREYVSSTEYGVRKYGGLHSENLKVTCESSGFEFREVGFEKQ